MALAELDVGISIFPHTTYTPNPVTVSKLIAPHSKTMEYYLVWSRKHEPTHIAQSFIDFVADYIQEGRMKAAGFSLPDWGSIMEETGIKPVNK